MPASEQIIVGWGPDELRNLLQTLESCGRSLPRLPTIFGLLPTDVVTSPGQWRDLAALYFESDDVDRVVCLIGQESAGNPKARNPETAAAGLLQLMPLWADVADIEYARLFEPEVNLWIARHILELQGWDAWSPYRRGACRQPQPGFGGVRMWAGRFG